MTEVVCSREAPQANPDPACPGRRCEGGDWQPANVFEAFEGQAKRRPEHLAIWSGDVRLTYRELAERVAEFGARLAANGVGHGSFVAIYAWRSPEVIVALLATLQVGAAYVGLDLESPPSRLAQMLRDLLPALVLTETGLADKIPAEEGGRVMFLDGRMPEEPPARPADRSLTGPDDLAYVSFTSGTTGRPKGVCIPHRGVLRLVLEPDYIRITPEDVFLHFAPLAFDASTFEVWGALLNGATLCLYPPSRPSLAELARFIERERVSVLWLTAGLFHQLVDAGLLAHLRGVRHLLAGGDVLSIPHVEKTVRTLPNLRLTNAYGPTENTTFTCCHAVDGTVSTNGSIPIGRAIRGTYCRVLGADAQPTARGDVGELYVGGTGLATGYLHEPVLTAERFVPDPFADESGARLYRTGDRVRELPDGSLEFIGRQDRQVKLRGFRVELDEVESALLGFPGMRGVSAVVEPGTSGNERLLVAAVTAAGESERGVLLAWARQHLPSFMLPSRLLFMDALPLNGNGKVDREALLRICLETPPPTELAEPLDGDHATVAAVWREVLGQAPPALDANFFDCGGDSLRATHFLARLHVVTGRSLPVDALLADPTVAGVAAALAVQPAARQPHVQVLRGGGHKPPLFLVPSQGGDLLCYAALARHMTDPARPLFGLQERAAEGDIDLASSATIEGIAAAHVETVQEVQPAGPYHLAGFCFGGLVAYEMACQLRAAGEEVAWLGVLDYRCESAANRPGRVRSLWRAPWPFVRNAGRVLQEVCAGQRAPFGWTAPGTRSGVRACGDVPDVPKLVGITADLSHYTARQLRLLAVHERAWQQYQPRRVLARPFVNLFRPKTLPLWRAWDRALGWEQFATGGVRVRIVPGPGTHGEMLKEPFVAGLASEMETALCGEVTF